MPRSASSLSPFLLLVLVLACLLTLLPSAAGQSYVPSPPAFTPDLCGANQRFVTIGTTDSSNSTAFPNNKQGTTLGQPRNAHTHVHH